MTRKHNSIEVVGGGVLIVLGLALIGSLAYGSFVLYRWFNWKFSYEEKTRKQSGSTLAACEHKEKSCGSLPNFHIGSMMMGRFVIIHGNSIVEGNGGRFHTLKRK